MYIRYRGTELGYMLLLDVMMAKDRNYFVCSCIKCIAEMTYNPAVALPNFCKTNVCVSFNHCYSRICNMLQNIKAINLKSMHEVATYTKFQLSREDICNRCLNCVLLSLREFLMLMPFVLDEYLYILQRV